MKNIVRKTFGLIIMLCCISLSSAYAQDGVKFIEGTSYADVLAQAKSAQKLLFIDCYTSWCGPCKMMANKEFPKKVMGDYFNPKFVCAKYDMEKGEGVTLKNKFSVRAFPTFLIIDPQTGNEVTRLVGGGVAEEFIKNVDTNLKKGGLNSLTERYDKGERSPEFVKTYIQMLSEAYLKDKCNTVASEFLAGKESQLLGNKELFDMFEENIESPMDETFQYVWKHKADFVKTYGEKVNSKLNNTWTGYPFQTYLKRTKDGGTFDKEGFAKYAKLMKSNGFKDADKVALNVNVYGASINKDWKNLLKLAKQYDKKYKADDMQVYNWLLAIEKSCDDKSICKESVDWITERVNSIVKEDEANKKKFAGTNTMPAMSMNGGIAFKKPFEALKEKLQKKL